MSRETIPQIPPLIMILHELPIPFLILQFFQTLRSHSSLANSIIAVHKLLVLSQIDLIAESPRILDDLLEVALETAVLIQLYTGRGLIILN